MTLTLTYDPDLQSPVSYCHDLLTCKSQQSIGSEDRVETNGQTDRGDRITSLANTVDKNFTGMSTGLKTAIYSSPKFTYGYNAELQKMMQK